MSNFNTLTEVLAPKSSDFKLIRQDGIDVKIKNSNTFATPQEVDEGLNTTKAINPEGLKTLLTKKSLDNFINGSQYQSSGDYQVGFIVRARDGNEYYCNKPNSHLSAVDPVGDNTDTWRRYPYYEGSNGGIEYRIYYDDTYEFWGREQVQSTKVPAGSGVSIYDGSKSINAPLSMMKGSGNRNCDSNCSDSPNITSESSIIYPVNLNTSTSLIIRAGGATATATPPATTTMDVDFRVWGKLVR